MSDGVESRVRGEDDGPERTMQWGKGMTGSIFHDTPIFVIPPSWDVR